MNSNRWRLVLFILLAAGLLVRLNGIFLQKRSLSHDESVSYLCAAATQGKYESGLPKQVDLPLMVADIQAYYAKPASLQFGTVAKDLAHDDIHPPLYFWMLHLVHWTVGMNVWNGPLLNLALTLALLVLLYRSGSELLGDRTHSLACCAIWFLSPSVVEIDLEARHYQLLALLALAMFMVGRRLWRSEGGFGALVLFAVINAFGLLTHYYYGFLLIPGLAIMFVRYGPTGRTWRYSASLLVSLILFFVLFPSFWEFLPVYLAKRDTVSGGAVDHLERAKALVASCLEFLSWWRVASLSIVLVGAGLLFWSWRVRAGLSKSTDPNDRWSLEVYLHLFWYFAFSASLYMAGISPTQAVGGEYFGYMWPLLCLALVHVAIRLVPRTKRGMIFVLFSIQLAISTWFAVGHSPYVGDLVPVVEMERMSKGDLMITNEGRRGYLPRLVMDLPGTMPLHVVSKNGNDPIDLDRHGSIGFCLVTGAPFPKALEQVDTSRFAQEVSRYDNYTFIYFTKR